MNFVNIETQIANIRSGGEPLRPAWLTDDNQWCEQLAAIPEGEAQWLAEHWDLAGGPQPALDMSWIQMETIGDRVWPAIGVTLAWLIPVVVVSFLVAR